MIHTWIIAEQVKCDFRITHIMQSEDVPHDDFRKEIIDICNSYSGRLIPRTTANIFMVFEKVDSDALFLAEPKKQSEMFIRLKTEHKTGCWDIISIQRAAWCLQENLDVLEYSYQNGSREKDNEIRNNPSFRKFLAERCVSD